MSSRKPAPGSAKFACKVCGKSLRPLATGDIGGPSMPAHKCPHGLKCSRWEPKCSACLAVLDVRPEILAPQCIFCAGSGSIPATPDQLACEPRVRTQGCPACKDRNWYDRGTRPPDRELLAEMYAGTGSVWSTR